MSKSFGASGGREDVFDRPGTSERFFQEMRTFGNDETVISGTASGGRPPYVSEERMVNAGRAHRKRDAGLRLELTNNVERQRPIRFDKQGTDPSMKRAIAGLCVLLLITFSGYIYTVARQIERQSTLDETHKADVIIVLGAAEYNGRPSPVLKARLNHALVLFSSGIAPYVMTTGGAGGDPVFTEGEVGRGYLTQRGVPSERILVEPEGATTVQSLEAAAEIMQRMNLNSCVVVSDGYHIYRVKRVLERRGIQVYGSPRPTSMAMSPKEMNWLYFRQAMGFFLWRLGINI